MKLVIEVKTSLLIGGHATSSFHADKITAMDHTGRPIIPASALKGAIRIACERLARSSDILTVCHPPDPDTMCRDPQNLCDVCSIFGCPNHEGAIHISDGILQETVTDDEVNDLFQQRFGVTIDRFRNKSYRSRLFSFETTPPFAPLVFLSDIDISKLNEKQKKLFLSALKIVDRIGANRARGTGNIKVTIKDKDIPDPSPVPDDDFTMSDSIIIDVEAIDPLYIAGLKPYGHFGQSLTYIPGSTLRGAFADKFFEAFGKDDPRIKDIFLNPETAISFGNAYPFNGSGESIPMLKTIRTCKKFPGPKDTVSDNTCRHGYIDLLLRNMAMENWIERGIFPGFEMTCPDKGCKAPLIPPGKSYLSRSETFLQPISIEKRIVSRVALDRIRNTARSGMLFSEELINPGTVFTAPVTNIPNEIQKWILSLNHSILYVGGTRRTGRGRARITFRRYISPNVLKRLSDFNKVLKNWIPDFPDENTCFSVDCLSDIAIPTDTGNPDFETSIFFGDPIWKQFRITPLRRYVSMGSRSGWNPAANLPKTVRPVIEMGSVFLFKASTPSPSALHELASALQHLSDKGVGHYKSEGYGRITICDPIHFAKEVF